MFIENLNNFMTTVPHIFIILLAVIALDFITGVLKALYFKTLSSTIWREGIIKKIVMVLFVVMVSIVDSMILFNNVPAFETVTGALIFGEIVSMIENCGTMIKFPKEIGSFLAIFKTTKTDEEKEE